MVTPTTEKRTKEFLGSVPDEMRRRPQWVVWKLEERDGKPTKVPYIAGGVGRASSTDLMTWRTFKEAVRALESGRYDGVGFVFCSADPFVGVDLDDCRDPETGEIEGWAREVIDGFADAVLLEASPSGRGVHIVTRGTCKDGINTKAIEVYGQDRYFTVTGVAL
jgi:primase-polymerase (primpol)-like protein